MDLTKILSDLKSCPCGHEHTFDTEAVEIASGLVHRVGETLTRLNFPKKVLVVADKKTLGASDGILESLEGSGFEVKTLIYEEMKYARIEQEREVEAASEGTDGIISVGSGSLNDLCRVASFNQKKDFCIFATAPSMDGFASDSAPIIVNNFKESVYVAQPRIILADTKILAAAPAELKKAGFGDMMAKYLGIYEWRIANMLIDEYYCERIASITLDALDRVARLADHVTDEDEECAGAIMEALVLSGLAMKLAGTSRPASGCEHVLSHYWECRKLTRGIWPEFHGKKVGVATVYMLGFVHDLFDKYDKVSAHADTTDWEAVYGAFDESQIPDVKRLNSPTITDKIDPARLEARWADMKKLARETLPTKAQMLDLMHRAGCAVTLEEIHVDDALFEAGVKFHSYMRYRLLITRILPMIDVEIMDFVK